MEKRYQVFISSTFQDLQEERQEVMHALLELDSIPSGMELFPAANETQWELIKRVIEDCDYYILVLGGRYGSIGPSGISYTEMEYDYARAINKPTIAFIHREPGKIEADKSEQSEEGKKKLDLFRKKIEKRLCKHWSSATELGSVVSRSLIQLIKREPAIGWVKANELADKDATSELLKLRKEVEDLNAELASTRTTAPKGTESFAQGEDEHPVKYTFTGQHSTNYSRQTFRSSFRPSWNQIFFCVSPSMIHEASSPQVQRELNSFCESENFDNLNENKKLESYKLTNFRINSDDFQTIIVQLRALGLIAKSDKTRSVKDTETYWTLTPYGDEIMTRLRAIKKDDQEELEEPLDIEEENADE